MPGAVRNTSSFFHLVRLSALAGSGEPWHSFSSFSAGGPPRRFHRSRDGACVQVGEPREEGRVGRRTGRARTPARAAMGMGARPNGSSTSELQWWIGVVRCGCVRSRSDGEGSEAGQRQ
jgi:hypothetical protein